MLGEGFGREQLSSSGCVMLLQKPTGESRPPRHPGMGPSPVACLLSWFVSSMFRLPARLAWQQPPLRCSTTSRPQLKRCCGQLLQDPPVKGEQGAAGWVVQCG